MGGHGKNSINTTEIFQNGVWKRGPELPERFLFACATQMNSTHTMITGGYPCGNCVYILNWSLQNPQWIEMPRMKQGRYGHSCITLPNGEVMVAYGYDYPVYLSSVEIYNPSENEWRDSISTPNSIAYGCMVLWKDSNPVIIGGRNLDDNVYYDQLFLFQNSTWNPLDIKMNSGKDSFFASMIPVSLLSNCRPKIIPSK